MKESPNIVVIGSLNLDMILESPKFPDEGETILGKRFSTAMGGKGANQAVAAARLGAKVSLIGAVGNDEFGKKLLKSLSNEGIDTSHIKMLESEETGIACVQVSPNDNRITVIPGANSHLLPDHIDQAEDVLEKADLVLLQMEIPLETVEYAIKKAKEMGKTVILNPAPAAELSKDILGIVDYLTPNETELLILAQGSTIEKDLDHSAKKLLTMGVAGLIVTLGENGAKYFSNNDEEENFSPHFVRVVDTTGAGDAFNGGLAYSLASGKDLRHAISLAMKVGAMAVTKLGAQEGMPTIRELESFNKKYNLQNII
ncbi:ribokinase [Sporosarcina jiandibaonis]|uniref:ribokinase n=1 Tax=Sporosarcina jiandibaonis TaxID=2715535 RepID=UPI001556AD8E